MFFVPGASNIAADFLYWPFRIAETKEKTQQRDLTKTQNKTARFYYKRRKNIELGTR
jgi:hypothetical protein